MMMDFPNAARDLFLVKNSAATGTKAGAHYRVEPDGDKFRVSCVLCVESATGEKRHQVKTLLENASLQEAQHELDFAVRMAVNVYKWEERTTAPATATVKAPRRKKAATAALPAGVDDFLKLAFAAVTADSIPGKRRAAKKPTRPAARASVAPASVEQNLQQEMEDVIRYGLTL